MLLVLLLLPAAPLLAQAPVGDATATRGANLRAGPGTTFAIVGGAAAGQSLAIVAQNADGTWYKLCLLYTSDAADERSSVDLGGRRIIKKKNNTTQGGGPHTDKRR